MPEPVERDSRIPLRDPLIAGVLAWLIPGLGHLYQGRLFKSAVYFFCITGTFLTGLAFGEWQIAYYRRAPGHTTYGFYAQILAGLPALPAVVQARRYTPLTPQELDPPRRHTLEEAITVPFEGRLRRTGSPDGGAGTQLEPDSSGSSLVEVSGTLTLTPQTDEYGRPQIRGSFSGETAEGEQVSLTAGDLPDGSRSSRLEIGPALYARDEVGYHYLRRDDEEQREYSASRRYLTVPLLNAEGTDETGRLEGTIPRPVWNWMSVPLEEAGLQDLHRRLARRLELALVFTWVAGLLNLLAIWDAVEGPAYGFGDNYFLESTPEGATSQAAGDGQAAAGSTSTDVPAEADAARVAAQSAAAPSAKPAIDTGASGQA